MKWLDKLIDWLPPHYTKIEGPISIILSSDTKLVVRMPNGDEYSCPCESLINKLGMKPCITEPVKPKN